MNQTGFIATFSGRDQYPADLIFQNCLISWR